MRPVTIVMVNEHPEDALKMLAVRDQQPVQTLGPNGPNEAFRHRVRCRRSSRRPHHLKAGAAKDRVEPSRDFLVAISDEKPRWVDLLSEGPRELAGLLRHPLRIGMARAARDVDATARQLNEEEHVQPLEPDGLHREKVDGDHRVGVCAYEVTPRHPTALAGRPDPRASQHLANRRRRDGDAEPLQLADDPLISPPWILSRETHDEVADFASNARSASAASVRPSPGHEPPMPAEQRRWRDDERPPLRTRQEPARRGPKHTVDGCPC